jgi:mannose-6-phosphate isomerase-like protein (cupin superfamily)
MIVVDVRDMPPEQWRLGVETRMLVSARNGAAQLCIFEQWIAPGAGAPTHTHPVEEVLTVREGEAEMWMDERRVIVSAGQSLIVPAERQHGFRNSGNVTLHLHAVLGGGGFGGEREGGKKKEGRVPPKACGDGRRCEQTCNRALLSTSCIMQSVRGSAMAKLIMWNLMTLDGQAETSRR